MKPYLISSASQRGSDQTDLPHQGSQSQPAINSKDSQVRLSNSRTDQIELIRTLTKLVASGEFPRFMFASRSMLDILLTIGFDRDNQAHALIWGETGTGKELIARATYVLSSRKTKKLITINCTAIPKDLVESTLFGHVKGAFTGATGSSQGILSKANGGTVLLDEIGELPLDVQPKLLRFLQEGEIQRVGADESFKIDVRVIAVTNRNLKDEVRAGRFREDLFERLNVMHIRVPPLRERREEIPYFTAHFLDRYQAKTRKAWQKLSPELIKALLDYDWPRNVRQLENEIRRLLLGARDKEVIGMEHLSQEIRDSGSAPSIPAVATTDDKFPIGKKQSLHEMVDELKRLAINNALEEAGGNQLRAADMLRIDRDSLRKAIKKLGIDFKKIGRGRPGNRAAGPR